MSFLRLSRSWALGPRLYSTTSTKHSNNLPLVLLGIGAVSAGGYWYLYRIQPEKPKQEKSPFDPQNFTDFKLKKVLPYSHNSSTFVFELPNNDASLIQVASFLLVRASNPDAVLSDKGKPIIRPYTPISPSDAPGELALLIKRYDQGNMSKHIFSLKAGDTLSMKGPVLKFPYQVNQFDEVVLIGGGSGITPLYQVLNHSLSDKNNRTKFKLIYSNVEEKDILLRKELEALQKKHPKHLEIIFTLDKPSEGWNGPTGFISAELIKKHVSPPSLQDKVKFFVCGPPPQVAAISGKKSGMAQGELGGILKELGYTEDQVYKF
ncbi:cytochrome-b5 reductase [Phlegmacium glaucopus]|nr:cytochrome-b5 reductase [Phlegmacium glaucopus]